MQIRVSWRPRMPQQQMLLSGTHGANSLLLVTGMGWHGMAWYGMVWNGIGWQVAWYGMVWQYCLALATTVFC